jgi:hypothetical protein
MMDGKGYVIVIGCIIAVFSTVLLVGLVTQGFMPVRMGRESVAAVVEIAGEINGEYQAFLKDRGAEEEKNGRNGGGQ